MIAALAFLACAGEPSEGTAVGNPGGTGSLDVVVTETPEAITLELAELAVAGLALDDCAGGLHEEEVGAVLDALPGSADALPLPGGEWCGLALSRDAAAEPLVLAGATEGGTTFRVVMDPGELALEEVFSVDETELLLALSLEHTLDAAALEAEGEDVEIGAEDARAVNWASRVAASGALWEDVDGDVDVGSEDLRLDEAGADMAAAQSAGCGCAQGGGVGGGLAALLGLLLAGSRRLRPSSPRSSSRAGRA